MKQSQLFTKTRKEVPTDEVSKNAQLLIRAGYINKEMAGVYAYLPLGLRVIEKIKNIVREEMNNLDGQEIVMTNLQSREVWESTTRWDDEIVDIWFKTKLKDETEVGLAWSHEEPIVKMIQQHVSSYKDLERNLVGGKGISVYQFQTKLRNELRAKSGIMRGREFLMKDMYSMHTNEMDLANYYATVMESYKKIFERLGIGKETFVTFASGGAFTKFSHEFQTICEAGEDWLHLDRERNIGVNEEVLEDAVKELGLDKNKLERVRSAETGNIFNFGDEKARQMGVEFMNEKGERQPLYLGSYGIGITRVMGVIAEKFADDKGLVWNKEIAPFQIHLVSLGNDDEVLVKAEKLYKDLQTNGVEVLWDDRNLRPGEKFADSDLIGIPLRIVVSAKTEGDKFEVKHRQTDEVEMLDLSQLIALVK